MTTKPIKRSKAWHIVLWTVQVLLAGMFLMAGYAKTFTPIEELTKTVGIAAEMPVLIRFIGISELTAAVGLLFPAALRIRPQLTTVAAAGLVVVMVLALLFHVMRAEYSAIGTNVVLGALAGVVVWGRLYKAPITSKSAAAHSISQT